MKWTWIILGCGLCIASRVYAQEFTVENRRIQNTSLRYDDPGYMPDGGFRVQIVEVSCVGGLYNIETTPVAGSFPSGSTPGPLLPSTIANKTAAQILLDDPPGGIFNFADVGQYEVKTTQTLSGAVGCTQGLQFTYIVTVGQPDLVIDEEEGSGAVSPGGSASSINNFITSSESNDVLPPQIDTPTLGEEKNDAVADSPDESATTPTRICEGKQLVRERMYAAANGLLPTNTLTVKEMLLLDVLVKKYLQRGGQYDNERIEKVFCALQQTKEHDVASTEEHSEKKRLVEGLLDMLLVHYTK